MVPSVGKQVFVDAPVPPALAALPETAPGQVAPAIEHKAPDAAFQDNLARSLGKAGVPVSTSLTSTDDGTLDLPAWLALLAFGLPVGVLTAAPEVRRRTRAARAG